MKRKPAVFALLAVVLAAFAFLLLRRPPPVPPVIVQPTPQQAARAQRHWDALQQELQPEEPLPRRAQSGRQNALSPQTRTLRLSEEDLNVYLAGNQAARKLLTARGVKAVQLILLEPSNLTIRAAISLKGHSQNVQLDGGLAPDPKLGLRYTATQAQVGRLPLPPAVVTAQANALAARFARQMHGRLPLIIQSVQVKGKMLVLTGLLVKRPASPPPASPAHH